MRARAKRRKIFMVKHGSRGGCSVAHAERARDDDGNSRSRFSGTNATRSGSQSRKLQWAMYKGSLAGGAVPTCTGHATAERVDATNEA
jgi:hypothetical protein